MIFIINGTLRYNSYDGDLYLIDGSIDMITLSMVMNELMLLMIKSNRVPLSREFILNDLWSKKGLNSSNNNLSNYVSMLRKTLTHCGLHDVITTIPKYGFVFSADVEVLSERPECRNSLSIDKAESKSVLSLYLKFKGFIKDNRNFLTGKDLLLLISALVFYLFLSHGLIYSQFKNIVGYDRSFKVNKCNVKLLNDSSRKLNMKDVTLSLKIMMARNNINCGKKSTIFYHYNQDGSALSDSGSQIFFAYCTGDRKFPCVNYRVTK